MNSECVAFSPSCWKSAFRGGPRNQGNKGMAKAARIHSAHGNVLKAQPYDTFLTSATIVTEEGWVGYVKMLYSLSVFPLKFI